MRVLIVEDDQLLRELYEDALNAAGFEVLTSRHAQEAVSMLDEYGAEVVVMDMMLPGHNGLEILHEMQSYSDWARIPVIVLSARHPDEFRMSQRDWQLLGVVKYLYKPETKVHQLVKEIAGVVAHVR